MKTLKALKSRLEGIEKINKITRAMEAIAATRLHRLEEKALRLRPYVLAQRRILENLALWLSKINSVWVKPQAENKKALVILICSDRGFCAGFNNQLFQIIKNFAAQDELSFIAIGKKGVGYLRKHNFNLIEESTLPDDVQLIDVAQAISAKVIAAYRQELQNVHLVFNQFRHNLLGRGFVKQLLPLETPEEKGLVLDYLFEPDAEVVLEKIMPQYIGSEVKAAILESKAAEEMARMVAMTQARRNAEDLIQSLTLEYHKSRQAGITKELIEVVSAI